MGHSQRRGNVEPPSGFSRRLGTRAALCATGVTVAQSWNLDMLTTDAMEREHRSGGERSQREPKMRELIGFIMLLAAPFGILMIWNSRDPAGPGLLILLGIGLFMQYRALVDMTRESSEQLTKQIYRLEEQLEALRSNLKPDSAAAPVLPSPPAPK